MRRADFLALTLLTVDELKTRTKRSQMPRHGGIPAEGGWAQYTPFDAFLVKISEDVAAASIGLTVSSWNVRNAALQMREDWQKIEAAAPDYFYGIARIDSQDGEGEFDLSIYGPASNVMARVAEVPGHRVSRVVLVNASRAWREIKDRAEEECVDLTDLFGERC